jgi:hypothetical protein
LKPQRLQGLVTCPRRADHQIFLALTLLVTRLGAADNPQNTFATYNFAVAANLLN